MKISLMILSIFVLLASCSSQKMIEGTNIKDTDDNQKIYSIMMKYNQFLEKKNTASLMKLVSKRYYDNAGTMDNSDDYGYNQLKEILEKRFSQIQEIFQTIKIKKIFHNKNDGMYYVIYQYNAKFLMSIEKSKQWHKKSDINQMVFVKNDEGFKIMKGL